MAAETQSGTAAAPTAQAAAASSGAESGVNKRGIHVSPGAVEYAKRRLAERGTPNAAIRMGIRGGGCSGFQYVIEFDDAEPRSRDIVSEYDGVRFYTDKKSLIYLGGSTLDYTKTMMFQGFKFLNPQEATKCGCGHSFTVK